MRVGIMGGTLDPLHNGHIRLAQFAKDYLKLDRVMLLPAGDPPHKQRPTLKTDRLEMARLAAKECEGCFACGIEVFRSGTTFTVDTLHELHDKNPGTQWYYIIGADTLDVLDTWRNFAEVARLCTFAVFGRAGDDASPESMRRLQRDYGAVFECLPCNGPDISSTDVRRSAARGESLAGMVPTPVEHYIRKRGLYICKMTRDEVIAELQNILKPSRFRHTLGVAETAVHLAGRFGADPVRAEFAALLHDCAKYMPLDEMRAIVRAGVPDADPLELETISVLHAPAGAAYAAQHFGVQDEAILSAIRKHTLGDRNMSLLDALIYTADFIEPNRDAFPGLEEARMLAEKDIYAAMYKCAQLTNDHLISQGRQPHPRSLAMIEQIKNNP